MKQYLQLFFTNIQKQDENPGRCTVVAFTSSVSGEGVSYTAQSFAVEMARRAGKRTLLADVRQLQRLNIVRFNRVSQYCFRTDVPNLWILSPDDWSDVEEAENDPLLEKYGIQSGLELAGSNLRNLRLAFDYILLDCPSLDISDEVALLAPETDGVIMVVEADRTRREQIQSAQQIIEMGEGKLLGYVLNKRNYIVPQWLYQRL